MSDHERCGTVSCQKLCGSECSSRTEKTMKYFQGSSNMHKCCWKDAHRSFDLGKGNGVTLFGSAVTQGEESEDRIQEAVSGSDNEYSAFLQESLPRK